MIYWGEKLSGIIIDENLYFGLNNAINFYKRNHNTDQPLNSNNKSGLVYSSNLTSSDYDMNYQSVTYDLSNPSFT